MTWLPWSIFFTKSCAKDALKDMENCSAIRLIVLRASQKKKTQGAVAGRGLSKAVPAMKGFKHWAKNSSTRLWLDEYVEVTIKTMQIANYHRDCHSSISVGQTIGNWIKKWRHKKLILVGGALTIFGHRINFFIQFRMALPSNWQGTLMQVIGTLHFCSDKLKNNQCTYH